MAYTDTWDAAFNAAPAGGAQVSGGDDQIRQDKLAVYQRLLTLVNDINADPLTLKTAAMGTIGAITGRKLGFGPHLFESRNDEDDTDHQDAYIGMNTSGLTIVGSLKLPHNATIKKIEASMDRGAAATCSLELYKINLTSGAKTSLDTAVRGVAGVGISAGAIANPPGINDVVDVGTYAYSARFFADGWIVTSPKLYGVIVTVDIASIADYV